MSKFEKTLTLSTPVKLVIFSLIAGFFMTLFINNGVANARPNFWHKHVCSAATKNNARCNASISTDSSGKPLVTKAYSTGYGPSDLVSAYKLPAIPTGSFSWNGKTVAIVDAYDNPNVAADLVQYRKQFKLPLCQTSSSNPTVSQLTSCLFTKVNQNGQTTSLPFANSGWGQEIDLDVQMASAACPSCKILLVEASSASYTNLGKAVNRAALMGANAISNSYGGSEFSSETLSTYNGYYNHSGIAVTVSSGDEGYGVEFPAASQYVTAVGGTSLSKASNSRGWIETAWNGGSSGCSAFVSKPAWQPTLGSCTHRVVADVSAVGDPATGVAVYDSYPSASRGGWYVFGGTSVGSPIIAALYATAGTTINYGEYPYSHTANLFDVTAGTNGSCISNLSLCTATIGFDGPTGLGSPNGLLAF